MWSIFNVKIFEIRLRLSCWFKVIQGQLRLVRARGHVKYVRCECTQAPPNPSCVNFKIFEIRIKVILLIQGHPRSGMTREGEWLFDLCWNFNFSNFLFTYSNFKLCFISSSLSDIPMKFSLFFLSDADTWRVHVVEFCTSELFPSSILLPFNQHVIFD